MLTPAQIEQFQRDGFVVIENAVTAAQLKGLRQQLTDWVEESRAQSAPFGPPTVDGRPRFDMGTEHSADNPALPRVNNPSDISSAYEEVMRDAATVDATAQLIGPDLKVVDLSLVKRLAWSALGPDGRVELRVDAFNVFNHTNLGSPALQAFAGVSDDEEPLPSFGRIRTTTTSSRQVQLGVRVVF